MHPNVVENRLETRDPDPKGGLESLVSNTSCVVLAELLSLSVLESPTGVSDNNSTNAVITSPRNMVFTGCWWYARHTPRRPFHWQRVALKPLSRAERCSHSGQMSSLWSLGIECGHSSALAFQAHLAQEYETMLTEKTKRKYTKVLSWFFSG